MVGGIFYEHSHRMVATGVGILTVILCVWIWRTDQRRWMRYLGVAALGAVVIQGALGGLTVLTLLPPAISSSHATLAQTFFCIVCAIGLFTSKWWFSVELIAKDNLKVPSVILCVIICCMIYCQLILGAIMRHTDSGLSVPSFPLAYGQVLPSLSEESMEIYNKQLIHDDLRLAADGPIIPSQIVIHLLHRYWGIVTSVVVLALAVRLRRIGVVLARQLSSVLTLLVVIQVNLGVLTVLTHKSVAITTAHVVTGALVLLFSVLSTLVVARLRRDYLVEPLVVMQGHGKFA